MLTFSILCEDVILRKDIAGGLGGQTGRFAGGFGGGILGAKIGAGLGLATGGPFGLLPGLSLGTLTGIGLGSVTGGQLGKAVGKALISNPESPADLSKPTHRIGWLAKPNTDAAGATIDLLTFGGGAPIYGGLRNAISDDGAKRLGYDSLGRTVQGVGGFLPGFRDFIPFMGAFKPGKIPPNK